MQYIGIALSLAFSALLYVIYTPALRPNLSFRKNGGYEEEIVVSFLAHYYYAYLAGFCRFSFQFCQLQLS